MEEIEVVKCECCGLKEECTQRYISQVKANFNAKWLCGLCSEVVRDDIFRSSSSNNNLSPPPPLSAVQAAVNSHMLFCRKFKSNPAVRVADGMKQILRMRSSHLSFPPPQSSSSSNPDVSDMSSFSTSSFT